MTDALLSETVTKARMQIKVYLVCMRRHIVKPGESNVQVVAARLTRSAAQAIVDATPGTYIEKHVAIK